MGAELSHIADLGGSEEDLSAGGVDVSRYPHEEHEDPVVVRAVDLLLDGHPPLDAAGLVVANSRAAARIFSRAPR